MTQEALKKMYQLLLTEPHAPTVCAQLERIAREALADHAMRETQRLGQEIEQEPAAIVAVDGVGQIQVGWITKPQHNDKLYTSPPQRTWVGLTDDEITALFGPFPKYPSEWDDPDFYRLTKAIEAKLKEKNT